MLSRSFPSRIIFAISFGVALVFLSFSSYRNRLHAPPPRFPIIEEDSTSTSSIAPTVVTVTKYSSVSVSVTVTTTTTFSASTPAVPTPSSPHPKSNNRCDTLKRSEDIVVILKTGANEVYEKLPTQILTMLQCVDDLLIFSDLEQKLGAYHIYDALETIGEDVMNDNPDFDYYRTLQEYEKTGQDLGKLRDSTGEQAWNLDKYKFMPMLEKTWQVRPNKKWYVYIEADTYLIWSNLLLWLDRLDPNELIYRGSPTYSNNEAFAHGGSGYVLSGTAMAKVFEDSPGVAAKYNPLVKHESMGDYMLMKALREEGVEMAGVWPILQGETPATIPFGGGPDNGARHWCQPVVTMHHISATEVSELWRYELERSDPMKPFLLEEMYHNLIQPKIVSERDDWYNLSDDVQFKAPGEEGERQRPFEDQTDLQRVAHTSFEACRSACGEDDRCHQFSFHDSTCNFQYSIRLGEQRSLEFDGQPWKSGWMLERIEKEMADYPCHEPKWE